MEIELKKKEIVSGNTLAGKPISITKFKNGEVLTYNSQTKQWEAKAPDGTVDLTEYYTKSQVDGLIPDISNKVDKILGKGLSTNDLTNELVSLINSALQSETSHADVLVYGDIGTTILPKTAFSGLNKITVGTTEPVAPQTNDIWIDTN